MNRRTPGKAVGRREGGGGGQAREVEAGVMPPWSEEALLWFSGDSYNKGGKG